MVRVSAFLILVIQIWALHAQFVPFSVWEKQPKVLKFTTNPQTLLTRNCSGTNTVQSTYGKTIPLTVTSDLTVNLSSQAGVTYFSDPYCTQVITEATIVTGTNSVNFYFTNEVAASFTVTVSATDYWDDEQTHSFTATDFLWTGAGAPSTNWATGANWSGGSPPGTGDLAVFDSTCVSNCDPSFSTSVDIGGIRMDAGYTGTIAPGTYSFTVRNLDFVQRAGTYIGDPSGSAQTNMTSIGGNSALVIAGGTFTYAAGITRLSGHLYTYNTATINIPTNAILRYDCISGGWSCRYSSVNFRTGGEVYEYLEIQTRRTDINLIGSTLSVAKDFTNGDYEAAGHSIDNGTIAIGGNYNPGTNTHKGTGWFEFTGNPAGQTIDGQDKATPGIRINAGANTVTFNGIVSTEDYEYVSGTLITTGSTLYINCYAYSDTCRHGPQTAILGTHMYNNVTLAGRRFTFNLAGATWNIGGDFSFGDKEVLENIHNGTINVYGNVIPINFSYKGTALIRLLGNASGQTITGIGNFPYLEINAGANDVTLAGTIRTPYFDYVSSGTFTTAGSKFEMVCDSTADDCRYGPMTMNFGGQTFNDLDIRGRRFNVNLGGQTINVAGNFRFGEIEAGGFQMTNGTINVWGNLTELNWGYQGNSQIIVKGNAAGQTLTGLFDGDWLYIDIDTGTNPVTLVGEIETNMWTYTSSGAFNSAGSTVKIECDDYAGCNSGGTFSTINFGSVTYDNIKIQNNNSNMDFTGQTVTATGSFELGSSTVGKRMDGGTFNIGGDFSIWSQGVLGTTQVVLTGNASGQTINGSALGSDDRYVPHIQINAGTHPVTLTGYIGFERWTYVSSGTFTATGSYLDMNTRDGMARDGASLNDIIFGPVTYGSLELHGERNHIDFGGATINLAGDFLLGDDFANYNINNATFAVRGNVTMLASGNTGNASLSFIGGNAQTLSGNNIQMPDGTMTIAKTAGTTLTILSRVESTGAGQDFTMTSGNVDLNGQILNINDVLTIGAGTTFTQSGGTLNYGTLVNNGTLNP